MFRNILVAVASATFVVSAHAVDANQVDKSYPLSDGSTVYVFKDGKMAMESQRGVITRMKAGHVMQTKDGQKLVMIGDEVFRLEKSLGRVQSTNP